MTPPSHLSPLTRRDDAPAGLFLSRAGRWYHDGDPVEHAGLEGLLHRSIARAADGSLIVTTGRDVVTFVAEDAPFIVRTIEDDALVLSDDTREPLISAGHATAFFIDDVGHVRCPVKQGAYWALMSRSATQILLALIDATGSLTLTPTQMRDWSAFAIKDT